MDAAAALACPLLSVKAPAATLTVMLPLELGVGLTSSVADLPSVDIVKTPLLPPATTASSTPKLVPTFLLKLKMKVTSPAAVTPVSLSVMLTVGAASSAALGGASASPPPQADNNSASAREAPCGAKVLE